MGPLRPWRRRRSWRRPTATPQHAGDGQADGSSWLGYGIGTPVIAGITPDNGVSSSDGMTNSPYISLSVRRRPMTSSPSIEDGNEIGQTIALPSDTWIFSNTATKLSDGNYSFTVRRPIRAAFPRRSPIPTKWSIDTHVPSPPVLNDISPDTGLSNTDGITDVNTPTFSGSTEPFAVVDLYSNGSPTPFGATEADISGDWSFTVGQPGQVTYPGALSSILSPAFGALRGILSDLARCSARCLDCFRASLRDLSRAPMLADGTYNVTATAMDIAGTTSPASSPMTIVIDTQAPAHPRSPASAPYTQEQHRRPGHGAEPDHLRDGGGGHHREHPA